MARFAISFAISVSLRWNLRVENRNLTIKGGLSQIETILRSPSRQSIARSVGRLLRRSCQFDEGIDTENIRVRPEWRSDWTMFNEHGGNQGIEVCVETRSRRSRAAAKKRFTNQIIRRNSVLLFGFNRRWQLQLYRKQIESFRTMSR